MSNEPASLSGPDLVQGVRVADIPDGGTLLGHAADEPVLLARQGDTIFAVGATCTHYGGPLAEGLVVGETVRCPWHHACFSLRTGEALGAPALAPVSCWTVELMDDRVRVRGKLPGPTDGATPPKGARPPETPRDVVIVGSGAAGNAAAETLRRCGYAGGLTLIGSEDSVPYDRPNLSKDYLAGNAPEEWIPLHPRGFYDQHRISLRTGHRATALDSSARRITLDDGSKLSFDRLLLATGADPIRLPIPGEDRPHVHYLRSLADSRAIAAAAGTARSAVVMGASFIGLEVAAALRSRGLDVHVVAPEQRPLERILGPEIGAFVRSIHEAHGVSFHLGTTAGSIGNGAVTLNDGSNITADLVVIGAGVRPALAIAEGAGITIDRGVVVNEFLETSVAGIYAAGDIARYPDPRSGASIRVEHWAVAERQGRTAARNILGFREPFDDVPFFWSAHYDVTINYVGHAERWDRIEIEGSVPDRSFIARYVLGGRLLAAASVGRDLDSLRIEAEMERT